MSEALFSVDIVYVKHLFAGILWSVFFEEEFGGRDMGGVFWVE